jgi:hypothetical protein
MTRLAVRHAALHVRLASPRLASPLAQASAGGALQSPSMSLTLMTGGGAWGRGRWSRRYAAPTRVTSASANPADASDASAKVQQHCDTKPPPLPRVLVIAGPTAVGKTSLSLRMAKALGGEIVSADSVQVYKGLDVGSSKLPEVGTLYTSRIQL